MVRWSNDIVRLAIVISIVIVLGVILSFKFFKLDLTEEKRHSLTETTIETLRNVDQEILFKVYLTGELPNGYKKLENAIREKLDEFKDFSNDKIDYQFINPYVSADENENKKFWEKLVDGGIIYTREDLNDGDDVKKQKVIFHGAFMNIGGIDYPINFLKSSSKSPTGPSIEGMVNNSITNLEYELISKITQHTRQERPRIGILDGHGEFENILLGSITLSLREFYDLERVYLDERIDALSEKLPSMKDRNLLYDAIIVAGPTQPFSDRDQFILDQYVMNGGKVMWFLDPMSADMDSLVGIDQVLALPNDIGLSNMLFDYGVRLNNDLIIDENCQFEIMDVGAVGDKRRLIPVPWFYSPRLVVDSVLMPFHPINKNLHNVASIFASSIDLIENDIKKKVLLTSSKRSRRLKSPVRVNLNLAQFGPEYFDNPASLQPHSPVAVLLEGKFQSSFLNRGIQDTIRNSKEIAFKESSSRNSMIVVSDADIIRNELFADREGNPRPRDLGYDKIKGGIASDNTEFIMNCMNYLLNDEAVISVRTRTFKSRLLSNTAKENESMIKFLNVGMPILIISLLGLLLFIIRKRKFARQYQPE